MVIPQGYEFEKTGPLTSTAAVNDYLQKVEKLTQLSGAIEVLLAAQHNKLGITCIFSMKLMIRNPTLRLPRN